MEKGDAVIKMVNGPRDFGNRENEYHDFQLLSLQY